MVLTSYAKYKVFFLKVLKLDNRLYHKANVHVRGQPVVLRVSGALFVE